MSNEAATVTEPAGAGELPDRPAGAQRTAPQAAPVARAERPGTRRWWILAAIVAGYLLHVAWRIWLARSVPTPVAHADEDRYLLSARVLAGGPGGLGNDTAAFRRMGYPLILTPIYFFTSDAFKVYHAAQAIGAALNALTFPLAYLFARRVFGAARSLALGAAFVAATFPAVAYYAQFTLTDVLFAPIGLAWLLLLHGWLTGRGRLSRAAAAIGSGAVVGYAYTVHVRGLVMLGVFLGALAVLVWMRRAHPGLAAASALTALAVTRVDWLTQRLVGDSLVRGGVEPNDRLLERLTDARGLVQTLCDAAGQIWYAGVGTWGLAAIGLVVAVARVRGRDLEPADWAQRFVLGVALAATGLIAFSSSAALPEDMRVSNHTYFRYIAFLTPVWVILAVRALHGAGRRRAVRLVGAAAAVTGATAFLVLTQMGAREWFHPFDTPEVSFMTYTWDALPVARASLTALIMLSVLAVAISLRHPGWAAPVALGAVLLINVAALEVVNAKSTRPMSAREYRTAPLLIDDVKVTGNDVVASSKRVSLGVRLNHQRELYWYAIAEFDDRSAAPPANATVVIAPWTSRHSDDWDGAPLGWRRVDADPVHGWAVWLRNSDPRVTQR